MATKRTWIGRLRHYRLGGKSNDINDLRIVATISAYDYISKNQRDVEFEISIAQLHKWIDVIEKGNIEL